MIEGQLGHQAYSHCLTLWLTDLKNSKTELPDLSNYVQMDEKTTKNAKIMKVTHSLSRYL